MVLGATEKPTVPLQLPLIPDVTDIHGAWLTADQLQPAPVVRLKLHVPPLPLKLSGEYLQRRGSLPGWTH